MARDAFVVGLARGHPPGHVVLRKAEFGQLVHDDELAQCGLLGEFAAESDAVVEQAEHRVETASGRFAFAYRDAQLVVAVADEVLFAPDLLPGLVERCPGRGVDRQPVAQRRGVPEFESECREVEEERLPAA